MGEQLLDRVVRRGRILIRYSEIESIAAESGLHLAGMISAIRLRDALATVGPRLGEWQNAGYAGEMRYMLRPLDIFLNPENLLPGLKSIVSFAVPYAVPVESAEETACAPGFGRITRYARGRDYHRVIKKLLRKVAQRIEGKIQRPLGWRAFSDAVPFLERAAAVCAGLGFLGKNTMLIRPGLGSYFFLAELLLDIDIEPDSVNSAAEGSCGACNRCQIDCPTGAFVAPGRLDARLCISYLTIEKTGGFTGEERKMLGNWIFGCDRCQEVCPFNHRGVKAGIIPEFSPKIGAGAVVSLARIFSLSSAEEFAAQFSGTPLMRTGREGMIRNALAVCANQGCSELIPAIRHLIVRESSEMIKQEAHAALSRLG